MIFMEFACLSARTGETLGLFLNGPDGRAPERVGRRTCRRPGTCRRSFSWRSDSGSALSLRPASQARGECRSNANAARPKPDSASAAGSATGAGNARTACEVPLQNPHAKISDTSRTLLGVVPLEYSPSTCRCVRTTTTTTTTTKIDRTRAAARPRQSAPKVPMGLSSPTKPHGRLYNRINSKLSHVTPLTG